MKQPADLPQPRWLRPTLIGVVIAQLVLAVLIDARQSPDEHAPWLARLAAMLIIGFIWLLELLTPAAFTQSRTSVCELRSHTAGPPASVLLESNNMAGGIVCRPDGTDPLTPL